ncbi:MAG: hypothetical protein ACP5IL_08430 [Syntrophobacteraceae bacterium]
MPVFVEWTGPYLAYLLGGHGETVITLHIIPYGRFDLDMDARIPLEQAA